MMTKKIRIPITFWTLIGNVISQLKPQYEFNVLSVTNSLVTIETSIEGIEWLYEMAVVMMSDMSISSNYRVTARRAWWRLKYSLESAHLNNKEVICVDGVHIHLTENIA